MEGSLLLGYSSQDNEDVKSETEGEGRGRWKKLPKHQDEDQVQLDVNRSFIYYPNSTS